LLSFEKTFSCSSDVLSDDSEKISSAETQIKKEEEEQRNQKEQAKQKS